MSSLNVVQKQEILAHMTAFKFIDHKRLFVGREKNYLLGETTRYKLSIIGPYLSCVQLRVWLVLSKVGF